jgi:hypothetical protein
MYSYSLLNVEHKKTAEDIGGWVKIEQVFQLTQTKPCILQGSVG